MPLHLSLKSFVPFTKHKNWLLIVLGIAIALGIVFRFHNLDLKVFWADEVINAQYMAGYTDMQLGNQVQQWDGQIIEPRALLKYQTPNRDTTSFDVIRALAIDEPQSPPLYYLCLRWWIHAFGTSIAARRSLSVCFSLVALVLLFRLCSTLFKSSTTAWIATALVAVSPIHLIYAQEARYYAAWTASILLSTLMIVWAVRKESIGRWLAYALTTIVGLYTFPLTMIVICIQGFYVLSVCQLKFKKVFANYLFSVAGSIALYSPWLYFIAVNSHKISDWRQKDISILRLAMGWVSKLEIAFWDLHKIFESNFQQIQPLILDLSLKTAIVVAFFYSMYVLWKTARDKPTVVLLYGLIVIPWATMAIPDLVSGGIRSLIARYLLPSYLGMQISMAYMFTQEIERVVSSQFRKKVACLALSFFLTISMASSLYYLNQDVWWNKNNNVDNPHIAEIINSSTDALVIAKLTGDAGRSIISLSYSLDENVKLQLYPSDSDLPEFDWSFEHIYLYNPSDNLLNALPEREAPSVEIAYEGVRRSLYKVTTSDA